MPEKSTKDIKTVTTLPKPKKNKDWQKAIFIGILLMTIAFAISTIGLFVKDVDNDIKAERRLEIEAKESAIKSKELEFQAKQQKNALIDTYFNEYFPDMIIVNTETGKVVLTQGISRGISSNKPYAFYRDGKILGYFAIDIALNNISFGRILRYSEGFPTGETCFKAELSK